MSNKIDKSIISSAHIDKVYDDVKDLFLNGTLEKELFFKCLISLAYEYVCVSDLSNCVHLISECDSYYINNTLSKHMEEDAKFEKLVTKLVDILEKAGIPLEDIESEDEALWMKFSRLGKA